MQLKKILQSKIRDIKPKCDLLNNVRQIWDSFPQETIDRLIMSFEGRLRLVINKQGESISDELTTSLTQIPSFPFIHSDEVQLDKILTFKDETIDDNPIEYRAMRKY